jgi:amidase
MTLMDPTFAVKARPAKVRLGVVNVAADAAVEAAVRKALAAAGVSATPIYLPSFDEAYSAGLTIIAAENWTAFGHLTDSGGLGADVRARLLAARDVTREAVAAAEACRIRFRAEVDAVLERVDALALPTLPIEPLTLEAAADARASLRLTALVRVFNLSGHPALTIPLETAAGLPAGLQLVGRRMADANLCAVAQRVVENVSRARPHTQEDPVCS